MPIEIFLVPMVGTNPTKGKYRDDPVCTRSATIRYARTDAVSLTLLDAPQAYLDSVAAQPDATRLATASNIDTTISAGLATTAKAVFEAAKIPQADTRRQVIRRVAGLFLFSQRMEGKFGEAWTKKMVNHGVTLDSTWISFPQALKDSFIALRDEKGWGNLGITGASTMREILLTVTNQYASEPMFIGGVSI
jgi:hypothetical protein